MGSSCAGLQQVMEKVVAMVVVVMVVIVTTVNKQQTSQGGHLVLGSKGGGVTRAMAGKAYGRLVRFQLGQACWGLSL